MTSSSQTPPPSDGRSNFGAADEPVLPKDQTVATTSGASSKRPGFVPGSLKKFLFFVIKAGFSVAMLWLVVRRVASRDGADALWARLSDLSWGWWGLAVGMQLIAIGFAVVRWRTLLRGQGLRAPYRFLIPSFWIGRFYGAFTPGGLGLDGWRFFDVSVRTSKVARCTAVACVEKILGQLSFGAVVLLGSLWGLSLIGTTGVVIVNLGFLGLVIAGVGFLAAPLLFVRFLPSWLQKRVAVFLDAINAFRGQKALLVRAALFGIGVHAFNNLIYVCAARAVGVDLDPLVVFFGSSLTIMVTLLPVSINGIGLREATAVALYTSAAVGLSETEALLIPLVGISAEYAVSLLGAIPFVFGRVRRPEPGISIIEVEERESEQRAIEAIEHAPAELWPKLSSGLRVGLGAGIFAGLAVGLGDGLAVIVGGGGRTGFGVLTYSAVAYGILCALGGTALGGFLAATGRFLKRPAIAERTAYARMSGFIVAVMAFALGAFRIRRDVFHEELAWKSLAGLALVAACALFGLLVYVLISSSLRWLLAQRPTAWLLRSWGSPIFAGGFIALVAMTTMLVGTQAGAAPGQNRSAAPPNAGNVLFIVVDTLRADHLPSYGYQAGSTPHLDAFGRDAVRFDQAFANSSWTRPSFASLLTGRHASSHGVMSKSEQLPDAVITLPESLSANGYSTAGFVTNFNVAPYFNFQQGFHLYRYLEPEFVLGADDAAAKLLLVQFVRKGVERYRAARGIVQPGTAYQDAQTVNEHLSNWLSHAPPQPWFLFVGYMDPHDPYFIHPYDGDGYSRAAHPHPDPAEAPRLRQLYDGEISYWDARFGELVEDLKRRRLYDDLTIIVTSDHGEEFHDHGGFWHGTTLYDEQVRVPLLVKLPQSRRGGTVVSHWVQSVDVMPTLLSELGIDVPNGVQGGDLFSGTDRIYAEESHEGNVLESVRERRGTDELKLIVANEGNPRGLEPAEVYRVDLDPAEADNMAERNAGGASASVAVGALSQSLDAARRHAREGAVERQAVELEGDTADRLRAIGYAVGEE